MKMLSSDEHDAAETAMVLHYNSEASSESASDDETHVTVFPGTVTMSIQQSVPSYLIDAGKPSTQVRVSTGKRTFSISNKRFDVTTMVDEMCLRSLRRSELAAQDISDIANLLGRYPAEMMTQVAHLDAGMCMRLVEDYAEPPDPGVVHCWDADGVADGVRAKMCFQLERIPHFNYVGIACAKHVPGGPTDRVMVLIPVLSESCERMEIGFGGLRLAAPKNTRFTHFGVSVPWAFRGFISLFSAGLTSPFCYIKTGSPGLKQLQFDRICIGMALTGLDYRAESFPTVDGSAAYSLTPLRSGRCIIRFRELSFLTLGCLRIEFDVATSFVMLLPSVHARSPMILNAFYADTPVHSLAQAMGGQSFAVAYAPGGDGGASTAVLVSVHDVESDSPV